MYDRDTPAMRLAPGVSLTGSPDTQLGVALVCGHGKVQLNRIAADILSLCDGSRDGEAIVARIVAANLSTVLDSDVREFLQAAFARGWIVGAG